MRALALEHLARRVSDYLEGLSDEELGAVGFELVDLKQLAEEILAETKVMETDDEETPDLPPKVQEKLEAIAKSALAIPTLKTQYVGKLDFHEVAVWQVEKALEQAYLAGMADHRR
ncbi:DUF6900 domain-containing protein [Pandoraea sputorum]